jgi:mRNA interferase MazF
MEHGRRQGRAARRRSGRNRVPASNEIRYPSGGRAPLTIRRGQIWWVDFGKPKGSEPGYRHPALVLQRNEVNASRINTVVVCVLTSNRLLAKAPGNMLLPKRATGLPQDSVANASQIATVNKSDLDTLAGILPEQLLNRMSEGLRWFLGLDA